MLLSGLTYALSPTPLDHTSYIKHHYHRYMFVKFCGARCLAFLVRRKFVLTRLFICFAYFLVGVEYYHSREGWDRTTCVYFITVSTTTVGYGDYHPTTDSTRLFTTLYVNT